VGLQKQTETSPPGRFNKLSTSFRTTIASETMTCYLCAYNSRYRLLTPHPLPDDSPAPPRIVPVGTCKKCSVWACSEHGRRLFEFKCAMCVPGEAVEDALGAALHSAAVTEALWIGRERGDPYSLGRMHAALSRIVEDRSLTTNLASTVYEMRGQPPAAPDGETRGVSPEYVEAVSSSVRSTFEEPPSARDPLAAEVLLGAIWMAYAVADPEAGPGQPPWQLAAPTLLDPMIWLVAVAYFQS
jgi:hypothetical protein